MVNKDFSDKESQLVLCLEDLSAYYGGGLFFPIQVPDEMIGYIRQTFSYYRVNVPEELKDLFVLGAISVLNLINFQDPYLILFGDSDAIYTNDWETHTYEVYTGRTEEQVLELDPHEIETFSFYNEGAQKFKEKAFATPGCTNFPDSIRAHALGILHACVDKDIDFFVYDATYIETLNLSEEPSELFYEAILNKVSSYCYKDGIFNETLHKALFDLSIWASFVWLFGPDSRSWKNSNSEFFNNIYSYNECIMCDRSLYAPHEYRKVARPPQSCYLCGKDTWCVSLTCDDVGSNRYICEACATKDMPVATLATCGTKFCKKFDCPSNLFYNQNPMMGLRNHGILTQKGGLHVKK